MKIAVLHGQMHQGSTYHITKMVLDRLSGPDTAIREFFMPKDMPAPCVGCNRCFFEGEVCCPQADTVRPVAEALEEADLIVLESPCYVFGMTGQLKVLLDHLGYRWMPHRPHPAMFRKVGLAVSTAAGGGADKVVKDLVRHLFFWGVPVTHRFSANVYATAWGGVKDKKRAKLEKHAERLAARIRRQIGRAKPGLKTRAFFFMMGLMQKGVFDNPADQTYWKQNGWLNGKTPWKDPA